MHSTPSLDYCDQNTEKKDIDKIILSDSVVLYPY